MILVGILLFKFHTQSERQKRYALNVEPSSRGFTKGSCVFFWRRKFFNDIRTKIRILIMGVRLTGLDLKTKQG